jgi:VIT1/CCC1 family predicted Fe2+/Mn2+ transporter
MKARDMAVTKLSALMREEQYCRISGKLRMVDLSPKALNVEPDPIRVLFSNLLHNEHPLQELHHLGPPRPPGLRPQRERDISSRTDFFAQLFISVVAALFLLVPMVVLSYIQSKAFLLMTTCLFVLAFVVGLSAASKASNQEIVAATAAYGAVLVVFVGQRSS